MAVAGPRIESLNDGERGWVEANLRVARSFVSAYGDEQTQEGAPSLAGLDRAWTRWLTEWNTTAESERDDPNPLINAVGVAFGMHLIRGAGLEWVIATDEYGTELALNRRANEVLVYPANLIAKRFTSRTTGFIADVAERMLADLTQLG